MKLHDPLLSSSVPKEDSGVYASLADLIRLRFSAADLTLLPRQPATSALSGRHASRLRGRGLNFVLFRFLCDLLFKTFRL